MDYAALANEINTDPTSMGYAAHVAIGSDAGVAGLLNAVGSARVNRGVVTRETFLADFGSQILAILSDATMKASFAPLLGLLGMAGTVDYAHQIVQAGLHSMVGIQGLTQDQITAITTRPCSRAEVLWGAGIVVTGQDVSIALRGAH